MEVRPKGSLLRELFFRFERDEVAGLAAELAYFFLLALFPFLIFLITLIGYLPLSIDDILSVIREYAPGQSVQIIEMTLQQILNKQNSGLLSFSIIFALWSASSGINAIVRSFNRAYEAKETRPFIVARGTIILLTVAMIFVVIVALLLPVFGEYIGKFIFSSLGLPKMFMAVWNAMRYIVSAMIIFIVLTALYYFGPSKRNYVKSVLPGSFAATVCWVLVSSMFSYYVSHFGNYSATYGSIGGIIVLLVWLYLTGMIIILGGELNAILYQRKQ
ncbi:YihY/virulence factor BrkB family protein [Metabacillus sp. GX 13764]|uniref:YihY/virulence factor BrkB family protein n=1 Tax=Metabacillus kandeliae TaxID=2900151 RepID=UPI001E2AEC8C|nr:YihY/virulence factor BrkB family protein [Metabacillus kandeliae]MCD7036322.1 YihY/virulence factor BrkB family protein [Metabacillus kandeliae]